MAMRNSLLLCVLLTLYAAAFPAAAQVNFSLDIEVAPPPARVEVVPPPRPGYAWAPGYWRWDGHRHVWMVGRWMHERPGSHWVADRWVDRDGRHHFEPGHWDRGPEHVEHEHRAYEHDYRR